MMNKQQIVIIWSWKRLFASILILTLLTAALTGFCVSRVVSARNANPLLSAVSLSYSTMNG